MRPNSSALSDTDEKAPFPCELSRLSIPNDPRFVEAACRFIDAVSRLTGFEDTLRLQITEGIRHVLLALLQYSFEPDEKTSIELTSERIPAGLKISLRDQGLPLSAERAAANGSPPGTPLYGLNAYFDEVQFRNRGREGKEIVLYKHLPDPSLVEYAAACGIGPLQPLEAGDAAARSMESCSARPLKPSEALEVSKTVYKAYGYSYPHDYVYYPEKIVELNRSGEIFSAVAVAENGEIAGHCSLQPWEENPRIAEMAQGVVNPQYRSHGCFAKLTEYLIQTARAKDLTGVFGEAVTTHPYSQKTAHQFGLGECALFLGLIPSAANFKGLGGGFSERGSMLVQFKYLKRPPAVPVYAPAHHGAMIAAILANLGVAPDLQPHPPAMTALPADTAITVKLNRALNLGRIRIDRYGRDAVDLLRGQVKALCLQKWEVIHLLLDLSDAATPHFCSGFEELGFFFAGILPSGLPSGDGLLLQYLNNFTVPYESLRTASAFAEELVAYVRERDPNRIS
jgi:Acetyltransferase (GNAT) family